MFTVALGTSTTGWEGQFRFLADQQGLSGVTARMPSASLLPVINAGYRSLRELVVTYGYTLFCQRGTTTALPTVPPETGETYVVIDFGASGTPGTVPPITQIKMIDFKDTSNNWSRLPELTLLQMRDYAITSTPARPQGWFWLNAGSVATNAFTKGSIGVTPVPNGGSYAIWSMPEFADLTAATDLFLYQTEDWRQWHFFNVMKQICGVRDKNLAKQMDLILWNLSPDKEGSPAYNIKAQAPTASGSRTWSRADNYRGNGRRAWG